jgi:putative transposase
MTNYRRSFIAGASYFFIVNLVERSSRLLIEHIDRLREAIRYTRARHPFEIDAVVVLPDHLHVIWTLPQGDPDYALRWRLIKTVFSRQLAPGEGVRKAGSVRASVVSGSAVIGNIRCVTKRISHGMWITSTSTQSSTGM